MHVQNVIIIEKRYCDFILCLIDLIFFRVHVLRCVAFKELTIFCRGAKIMPKYAIRQLYPQFAILFLMKLIKSVAARV